MYVHGRSVCQCADSVASAVAAASHEVACKRSHAVCEVVFIAAQCLDCKIYSLHKCRIVTGILN